MFRALSLLALISVAVATPNVPRTQLLSRQLGGSSSSSCSDVCLDVSDVLQSCASATTCCSSSVISNVKACVDCGVSYDVETESAGQDILDEYKQACQALGVDTGALTVDGSPSATASATAPSISASTASSAGASSRAGAASSPVFTPATALSSLEASASAQATAASASASRSASAAAASATSDSDDSDDSGNSGNLPGTAGGSGAAGLSAPVSLTLTAALGAAAVFLA